MVLLVLLFYREWKKSIIKALQEHLQWRRYWLEWRRRIKEMGAVFLVIYWLLYLRKETRVLWVWVFTFALYRFYFECSFDWVWYWVEEYFARNQVQMLQGQVMLVTCVSVDNSQWEIASNKFVLTSLFWVYFWIKWFGLCVSMYNIRVVQ